MSYSHVFCQSTDVKKYVSLGSFGDAIFRRMGYGTLEHGKTIVFPKSSDLLIHGKTPVFPRSSGSWWTLTFPKTAHSHHRVPTWVLGYSQPSVWRSGPGHLQGDEKRSALPSSRWTTLSDGESRKGRSKIEGPDPSTDMISRKTDTIVFRNVQNGLWLA
jgi:hypothetical protein